ncbi:hypothetical protein BD626DRAFT_509362 [Schizophyllum amplum]|uniref:Uncharacterized protein n=1 Tax=Schizophyllum amplum TaxID=97359 RepID=A0A550C2F7_9AGAR|nr:hypothetical protein BD626DRAFT_509362 [Auriculariopsis ampla]
MPFAREDREEFDDSFLHPYIDRSQDDEECEGTWAPRALVELRMYQLSETLREKPEWWRKAEDPEIRKKWFEEAKAQQEDVEERWRLTDNMINYTLDELEDYAELRNEATGIECGPYDRIWRSDELIPDDLHAALQAAVKPLEEVPDEEKDWHPGSNGQVLDIVHPSLYPLVYGKSLGKQADGTINTFEPPGADDDGTGILERFVSQRFQWLPSDFAVRNDGSVFLASSYINNIAPEHAGALVPVIEQIMARAVPMWERVLADLRRKDMPVRVGPVIKSKGWYGASKGLACVWPSQAGQPYPEEELDDKELEAWYGRQPKTLPDAPPEYDGALGKREKFVLSMKGRTIQVIVKLANIVLTPDNPLYSGGTWHVEGMWNERIVSTFIYY